MGNVFETTQNNIFVMFRGETVADIMILRGEYVWN